MGCSSQKRFNSFMKEAKELGIESEIKSDDILKIKKAISLENRPELYPEIFNKDTNSVDSLGVESIWKNLTDREKRSKVATFNRALNSIVNTPSNFKKNKNQQEVYNKIKDWLVDNYNYDKTKEPDKDDNKAFTKDGVESTVAAYADRFGLNKIKMFYVNGIPMELVDTGVSKEGRHTFTVKKRDGSEITIEGVVTKILPVNKNEIDGVTESLRKKNSIHELVKEDYESYPNLIYIKLLERDASENILLKSKELGVIDEGLFSIKNEKFYGKKTNLKLIDYLKSVIEDMVYSMKDSKAKRVINILNISTAMRDDRSENTLIGGIRRLNRLKKLINSGEIQEMFTEEFYSQIKDEAKNNKIISMTKTPAFMFLLKTDKMKIEDYNKFILKYDNSYFEDFAPSRQLGLSHATDISVMIDSLFAQSSTPNDILDKDINKIEDYLSDNKLNKGNGLPTQVVYSPDEKVNKDIVENMMRLTNEIKVYESVMNQSVPIPEKLDIWFSSGENAWLSNLSKRPFEFNGKKYNSVEHAYQTNKSGEFEKETYDAYIGKSGVKIVGKKKANINTNIKLMQNLIYESFKANEDEMVKLISLGNVKFSHEKSNDIWSKEFPKALQIAKDRLEMESFKIKKEDIDKNKEPIIPPVDGNKTLGKYELFPGVFANNGQEEAIDDIKKWFEDTDETDILLKGRGGVGKTTVIAKVIEELGLHYSEVIYVAPSNKAVSVLSSMSSDDSERSPFKTIAQLLSKRMERNRNFENILVPIKNMNGKIKKSLFHGDGFRIPQPKVVVIDEASMVSMVEMNDIVKEANKTGARIIWMGDNVQLPPIEKSNKKESLVFTRNREKGTTVELSERMRQSSESKILPVTDALAGSVESMISDGNIMPESEWVIPRFDMKSSKDVEYSDNRIKSISDFVEELKKNPSGTRWIMFNNNQHTNGKFVSDTVRRDLFGKDGSKLDYNIGEQIYINTPSSAETMNEQGQMESVVLNVGSELTVKSIKRNVLVDLSQKYWSTRDKKYNDRDFTKIPAGNIVLIDNMDGKEYTVFIKEPKTMSELERQADSTKHAKAALGDKFLNSSPAYVLTTHKSQGSTYKRVYADIGNIFNDEKAMKDPARYQSAYVATSRPSESLVMIDVPESMREDENKSSNPIKNAKVKDSVKNSSHFQKDINMGEVATQFIGKKAKDGVVSSTEAYMDAWGDKANTGNYSSSDTVMISGSGPWRGVTQKDIQNKFDSFYKGMLDKVMTSGAKVVVGNANGMDRLVIKYLKSNGYNIEWNNNEDYYELSKKNNNSNSTGVLISKKMFESLQDRFKDVNILSELSSISDNLFDRSMVEYGVDLSNVDIMDDQKQYGYIGSQIEILQLGRSIGKDFLEYDELLSDGDKKKMSILYDDISGIHQELSVGINKKLKRVKTYDDVVWNGALINKLTDESNSKMKEAVDIFRKYDTDGLIYESTTGSEIENANRNYVKRIMLLALKKINRISKYNITLKDGVVAKIDYDNLVGSFEITNKKELSESGNNDKNFAYSIINDFILNGSDVSKININDINKDTLLKDDSSKYVNKKYESLGEALDANNIIILQTPSRQTAKDIAFKLVGDSVNDPTGDGAFVRNQIISLTSLDSRDLLNEKDFKRLLSILNVKETKELEDMFSTIRTSIKKVVDFDMSTMMDKKSFPRQNIEEQHSSLETIEKLEKGRVDAINNIMTTLFNVKFTGKPVKLSEDGTQVRREPYYQYIENADEDSTITDTDVLNYIKDAIGKKEDIYIQPSFANDPYLALPIKVDGDFVTFQKADGKGLYRLKLTAFDSGVKDTIKYERFKKWKSKEIENITKDYDEKIVVGLILDELESDSFIGINVDKSYEDAMNTARESYGDNAVDGAIDKFNKYINGDQIEKKQIDKYDFSNIDKDSDLSLVLNSETFNDSINVFRDNTDTKYMFEFETYEGNDATYFYARDLDRMKKYFNGKSSDDTRVYVVEDDNQDLDALAKESNAEFQHNPVLTSILSDISLFADIRKKLAETFPSIKVLKDNTLVDNHGVKVVGKAFNGVISYDPMSAGLDTLPHEYSHVYIDMLEETDWMKNTISKYMKTYRLNRYDAKEKMAEEVGVSYVKQMDGNKLSKKDNENVGLLKRMVKLIKSMFTRAGLGTVYSDEIARRMHDGANADAISFTPKKGYKLIDPNFDFKNQPFAADIVYTVMDAVNKGDVSFTGSEALAMQGPIYRPQDKYGTDLHDLDFATKNIESSKRIHNKLDKKFSTTKIYDFNVPNVSNSIIGIGESIVSKFPKMELFAMAMAKPLSKITNLTSNISTYVILPNGYSLKNIKRFNEVNSDEFERRTGRKYSNAEDSSRIVSYDIIDDNGRNVSSYSADIIYTSKNGFRTKIKNESFTGEKAILVDLMEDSTGKSVETMVNGRIVNVKDANDIFTAKNSLSTFIPRDKDVNDANTFHKDIYNNKNSKGSSQNESKSAELLMNRDLTVDNIGETFVELATRDMGNGKRIAITEDFNNHTQNIFDSLKEVMEATGMKIELQWGRTEDDTSGRNNPGYDYDSKIDNDKISVLYNDNDNTSSSSEVYLHELLHSLFKRAIVDNPKIKNQMQYLKDTLLDLNIDKSVFTVQAQQSGAQLTTDDMTRAKEKYDYALSKDADIEEFMAYVMSNSWLYNQIKDIEVNKNKSLSDEKNANFVNAAFELKSKKNISSFGKLFTSLFSLIISNIKAIFIENGESKLAKDMMTDTIHDMAKFQLKMEHKLDDKMFHETLMDFSSKIDNGVIGSTIHTSAILLEKISEAGLVLTRPIKVASSKLFELKNNLIEDIRGNARAMDIMDGIAKIGYVEKVLKSRLLKSLIFQNFTDKKYDKILHLHRTLKQSVDAAITNIKDSINSEIKNKSISSEKNMHLADTFVRKMLRNDISRYLNKINLDNLSKDSLLLSADGLKVELENMGVNDKSIESLNSLANHLHDGKSHDDFQEINAQNILNIDNGRITPKMLSIAKEYVSFKSASMMSNEDLDNMYNIVSDESMMEDVSSIIKSHTTRIDNASDGIRLDEYNSMPMGYIDYDIGKAKYSISIVSVDDYDAMLHMNPEIIGSEFEIYNKKFYRVKHVTESSDYDDGILGSITIKTGGNGIKSILQSIYMQNESNGEFKLRNPTMSEFISKEIDTMRTGTDRLFKSKDFKLMPLKDEDGNVKDWIIPFSNDDINLIEADTRITSVIPHTQSRLIDSVATNRNNEIAIDGIAAFHVKNKDDSIDFMKISRKKTPLIWDRLSPMVKKYINDKYDGKLMVPDDILEVIVGARTSSMANISLKFKDEEYTVFKNQEVRKYIKMAEKVVGEILSKNKMATILFNPDISIGNMISNMMLMWTHGVPPVKYIREFKKKWGQLEEYEKLSNRLSDLKIKESFGDDVENQIKSVRIQIDKHPFHTLVQDGQFTPMMEDMDSNSEGIIDGFMSDYIKKEHGSSAYMTEIMKEAYRIKSEDIAYGQRVETMGKYIEEAKLRYDENRMAAPAIVGKVSDVLYGSKGTSAHKMATKLVMYSDTLARQMLLDKMESDKRAENSGNLTENDRQQILNFVDKQFINYGYNVSGIQLWVEKIAGVQFLKYLFQHHKAYAKVIEIAPQRVLAQQGAQHATGINLADPMDTLTSRDPLENLEVRWRLDEPIGALEEAMTPNILMPFGLLDSNAWFKTY